MSGANVYLHLVEEMYPADAATSVSVPGLGDVLEGKFRDGFFTGVATVVSKLLIQSMQTGPILATKIINSSG